MANQSKKKQTKQVRPEKEIKETTGSKKIDTKVDKKMKPQRKETSKTKTTKQRELLKTPGAETSDEIKKLLIVVAVVVGVVLVFYLFTGLKTGDIKLPEGNKTTETTIQYSKILAGETFNQVPNDYLVVFYDSSSTDASTISSAVDAYKDKNKYAIYTVDLNDGFNKSIVSDTNNEEAQSAEDLKVTSTTLIKIHDGKNVDFISGTTNVEEYLK